MPPVPCRLSSRLSLGEPHQDRLGCQGCGGVRKISFYDTLMTAGRLGLVPQSRLPLVLLHLAPPPARPAPAALLACKLCRKCLS